MTRHEALTQRQPPCPHAKVARKETRSGTKYAVCAGCGVVLVARFAACLLATPPLRLMPGSIMWAGDPAASIEYQKEPQ